GRGDVLLRHGHRRGGPAAAVADAPGGAVPDGGGVRAGLRLALAGAAHHARGGAVAGEGVQRELPGGDPAAVRDGAAGPARGRTGCGPRPVPDAVRGRRGGRGPDRGRDVPGAGGAGADLGGRVVVRRGGLAGNVAGLLPGGGREGDARGPGDGD